MNEQHMRFKDRWLVFYRPEVIVEEVVWKTIRANKAKGIERKYVRVIEQRIKQEELLYIVRPCVWYSVFDEKKETPQYRLLASSVENAPPAITDFDFIEDDHVFLGVM